LLLIVFAKDGIYRWVGPKRGGGNGERLAPKGYLLIFRKNRRRSTNPREGKKRHHTLRVGEHEDRSILRVKQRPPKGEGKKKCQAELYGEAA